MEKNFDFSLIEAYTNVEYHVQIFHISELGDHRKELADLISKVVSEKNVKVTLRKDYQCPKTGRIFVHIEWFTYDIEKVSPHMKTIINPQVLPS